MVEFESSSGVMSTLPSCWNSKAGDAAECRDVLILLPDGATEDVDLDPACLLRQLSRPSRARASRRAEPAEDQP